MSGDRHHETIIALATRSAVAVVVNRHKNDVFRFGEGKKNTIEIFFFF